MKKLFILCFVLVTALVACNEDGSPLSFLNTDNLASQFYEINIHADTVLHTKNGADITIHKGSITAGNSATVRLEVKEAYSMEDIVRAGLQTTSNGKPLSSGGMIYLNVKDNKDAKIVSPIKISLPSNNIEKDMQLFKGDTTTDGKINWKDPKPLLPNKTLDSINEGKLMFMAICASCHKVIGDATGPGLAFSTQHLNKEWMNAWIHNSAKLIASGDAYANCIYNTWNKTAMTAFPSLTHDELEKMYKYLESETKNRNPNNYYNHKARFDSCQIYNKAKAALEQKKTALIEDNGLQVIDNRNRASTNNAPSTDTLDTVVIPFDIPENLISPKMDYSTYHQFEINSFGWYNIDVFTKDLPGFEASTLKVKIIGQHNEYTNVYLIVPESKILTSGGLLKDENDVYGFYTDEGNLKLPQGQNAFIMAFTEKGEEITFGLTSFTTSLKNEISVTPQIVSKESMNQKIKELNFKDATIATKDSKNAMLIRSVNIDLKRVELLKPTGADCNCGILTDTISEKDTASEMLLRRRK